MYNAKEKEDEILKRINIPHHIERLSLLATMSKIYTSPNASIIEYGDRSQVSALCSTNMYPQVFLRIGFSDIEPKASPRMDTSEALIKV